MRIDITEIDIRYINKKEQHRLMDDTARKIYEIVRSAEKRNRTVAS